MKFYTAVSHDKNTVDRQNNTWVLAGERNIDLAVDVKTKEPSA
jgi:hypothetical protein